MEREGGVVAWREGERDDWRKTGRERRGGGGHGWRDGWRNEGGEGGW